MISILNPKALIVIDVQNAIFDLPLPLHEPEKFVSNVAALVGKARDALVPVFFIQHCTAAGTRFEPGTTSWQIHPAIQPRAGELVIEKSHPDAFQGTSLDQALRGRGIHEPFICGFASQFCLDTTVRSAYGRGYTVHLASDAHSTTADSILSARQIVDHENLVLARFSKVQSTQETAFI